MRILVVEDHAAFRQYTCTVLRGRAEFLVLEAADGEDAIRLAEAIPPDLVLLDVNLPKLDGFEVARRLRALGSSARVLFLSQESSPEVVRQALVLGAHGYVRKVSAATDLLPAIDAVLAGRRFVSRSVAGFESAAAPAPRRHEIRFCPDDAAIVAGITGSLASALKVGDAAIALVTAPHRSRLLRELRARDVDVDGAIARGACVFLDADRALDPPGLLEAIEGARAASARAGKVHPRIAFCGERAGRLWAAGRTAEALELERLCDQLPANVDILCAYPVPYTDDDPALTRLCAEHTAVCAGS